MPCTAMFTSLRRFSLPGKRRIPPAVFIPLDWLAEHNFEHANPDQATSGGRQILFFCTQSRWRSGSRETTTRWTSTASSTKSGSTNRSHNKLFDIDECNHARTEDQKDSTSKTTCKKKMKVLPQERFRLTDAGSIQPIKGMGYFLLTSHAENSEPNLCRLFWLTASVERMEAQHLEPMSTTNQAASRTGRVQLPMVL